MTTEPPGESTLEATESLVPPAALPILADDSAHETPTPTDSLATDPVPRWFRRGAVYVGFVVIAFLAGSWAFTRLGGFWYTLADGGQQKLYDYVYEYLAIAGPEIATMMAESVHRSSSESVLAALDNAEAACCEELFMVPATAELAEIDRLSELLARR